MEGRSCSAVGDKALATRCIAARAHANTELVTRLQLWIRSWGSPQDLGVANKNVRWDCQQRTWDANREFGVVNNNLVLPISVTIIVWVCKKRMWDVNKEFGVPNNVLELQIRSWFANKGWIYK